MTGMRVVGWVDVVSYHMHEVTLRRRLFCAIVDSNALMMLGMLC
jgi:hypothetical protein